MATEFKLSYTGSQINEKLSKIDSLAEKSELPTKTSQLENDSGYISSYTETDPTVPSWAKEPNKPTYTASEVGALPADTDIPSIDGLATEIYVDTKIAALVNSAPEALNTLDELAAALGDDENFATTVTNQISSKLDASELPMAITDALAQAKASGEFDGEKGDDGTSVTVQSVSESTADGGSNVVTFSDGKTVTIKNGTKGSAGTDGKTPVKGTDYFTEADKQEIAELASELVDVDITSNNIESALGYVPAKANDITNIVAKLDYTNIAYGTCSTAADVAEKAVVLSGNTQWSLNVGSIIMVKFDVSNSAESVKINVNNTGAYPIWYNNAEYTSTGTAYTGYANRTITYMFNGTHYVWITASYDANSTYTNAALGQGYATCSTAAATTAKVGSLSSYKLLTGGIVAVKFTNAVPANATLNINSTGAKSIYFRGAKITADVIKAGDVATFVYSSYYHLISIDRWQNDIAEIKSDTYKESLVNAVIAALPVYNGEVV